MRLAAVGLLHETNTFAPGLTGLERFPRAGEASGRPVSTGALLTGTQIWDVHAGAKTTMAGFHDADGMPGVDVVPLVFATTLPSGIISHEAFEAIARQTTEALKADGPFDGVLMAQHGASVSEDYPDADAEMVRRVRAAVGPRVPIGVVVDTHGNLSHAQLEPATVTLAWQTNPHIDCREKGLECATLVIRTARGEISPSQAIERPPLALNILRQGNTVEPMVAFLAAARSLETEPGILTASIGEGFPYADVGHMGMAFIAISDGDPEQAREGAKRLARLAWELREQCDAKASSVDDAITEALAARGAGPVVLLDCGDNVGAGTPGDSTVLLDALMRRKVPDFLMTIWDGEVVAQIATVGRTFRLPIGAKTGTLHGTPVVVSGTVRAVADGRWEDRGFVSGGWTTFDAGLSALVDLDGGGTVLLTTKAVPAAGASQYAAIGLDVMDHPVIVSKAVFSSRSVFPMAQRFITVDTPGLAAANLSRFTYRHRRRPMFPFEREATYA